MSQLAIKITNIILTIAHPSEICILQITLNFHIAYWITFYIAYYVYIPLAADQPGSNYSMWLTQQPVVVEPQWGGPGPGPGRGGSKICTFFWNTHVHESMHMRSRSRSRNWKERTREEEDFSTAATRCCENTFKVCHGPRAVTSSGLHPENHLSTLNCSLQFLCPGMLL